ncbi:t-SNARE [Mycena floridula]|nr:t-SNARE [Mycena floridula]
MDRLALSRAQRQGNVQNNVHEMTSIPVNQVFLQETVSINEAVAQFNANVSRISDLNSRLLNANAGPNDYQEQIDKLTDETRALITDIRERIRKLTEQDMSRLTPTELETRKNRITHARDKFVDALQNYQRVEQDARNKARARVERQYRIVKPEATPQEVQAAVDSGQQVFAAVSARFGESSTAYREVQQRHEELKNMERTIGELAQMFNDMAYMVEQQQNIFENLERTTADVEQDVEKGADHTKSAVEHARNARRMRWIIFGICFFIVAVLAIALGIKFGVPHSK